MPEIGRLSAHKTTHQSGGLDELNLTGLTPGVHKTSHQDGESDEIDVTGLNGIPPVYEDRGDPVTADYGDWNLIIDGQWHDLNLSEIVPSGAKAVYLKTLVLGETVGAYVFYRKKGNENMSNMVETNVQVAGVVHCMSQIAHPDENRTIQYMVSPHVWDAIEITVLGWFK